jgi:hypothetical protein
MYSVHTLASAAVACSITPALEWPGLFAFAGVQWERLVERSRYTDNPPEIKYQYPNGSVLEVGL